MKNNSLKTSNDKLACTDLEDYIIACGSLSWIIHKIEQVFQLWKVKDTHLKKNYKTQFYVI